MKLSALALTFVIFLSAPLARATLQSQPMIAASRAFPTLTFDSPIFVTSARDGTNRLFVLGQGGKIWVFPNTDSVDKAKVFLDISHRVNRQGGELGALGLAFDPNYATNGRFYVSYATPSPIQIVVERFRVSPNDPDTALRGSGTIVFSAPKNTGQPNHNGGMIAFGSDGALYLGMGDGGGEGDPMHNGQNPRSYFGKILRINLKGKNPRTSIWAMGVRNPWRFSFDRQTGEMWLGDVGQDKHEEIDLVTRGANLGWNLFEGSEEYKDPRHRVPKNYLGPVFTYDHPPGVAVIGGYIYRGTLSPSLQGSYVYGDYGMGTVWALNHAGRTVTSNIEIAHVPQISSFGEDESGELLVVSLGGTLWRLTQTADPNEPEPPALLSQTGIFNDISTLTAADGVFEYQVNSPLWSDGALKRRWISLPSGGQIEFNSTGSWGFPDGTRLVKHFELPQGTQTIRVETRLLVRRSNSWSGYSYRWRADGSDADLLTGSDNQTYSGQNWHFPGRVECKSCHTQASGEVLGVITPQLNNGTQLQAMNQKGLFTQDIGDPSTFVTYPNPYDSTLPVPDRARSYLAVNCAHCHQPGGPAPGGMDLRYSTPLDLAHVLNVAPLYGSFGLSKPAIIKPGHADLSVLWTRMSSPSTGRMPPLASSVVDQQAVDLIGQWINQL